MRFALTEASMIFRMFWTSCVTFSAALTVCRPAQQCKAVGVICVCVVEPSDNALRHRYGNFHKPE